MHHRSKLLLASGALLLATPALSSCGFNLSTDRINTVQHGGTNRDGDVDVLGAVIISGSEGTGTLSGTLANNTDDEAQLASVTSGGEVELSAGEIEPAEITGRGAVKLADIGDGIRVEGDFRPGDVVDVVFEFDSGERVDVEVPVVRECGFYEELDSAPSASSSGSPSASSSETSETSDPSETASAGDEPSTEPTDEAAEKTTAWSCDTEVDEAH
ncbi:hypothetical protein [Nocardioides sp. cx-173]|uniref:hypothetical protein n=1 Tax=Nocardioides sp. cx-173 TaxID=2898796 RepID=UPI001E4B024F|nr:hypothetical protein [Nocardioides sp. cx-173]MCD4526527.1 hypothetical protein [Nocardioides sp. cx-173]UGB41214.1 hypothetical protein LQ940_17820 [Nocardioides sp. cx-173]